MVRARLQAWLEVLGDQFWLRPAIIVVMCLLVAQGFVWMETAGPVMGSGSPGVTWGYSGGAEGARALLGAVASSSIGVAGTVFSITVAALSFASGQMGPRLLRNFVRDGGNQLALGIFVGTFAYSLVVLRTVRTQQEGAFIPHLAVTGAIVLALACLATLVWFVHHIAMSINVEKVIDAVHQDLLDAVKKNSMTEPGPARPTFGEGARVTVNGSSYLQAMDLEGLSGWAAESGTKVHLRVRPGDYVPLGMPVAEVTPARDDAGEALDRALTFGSQPAALQDLEYSVRQLTEIAVRALSPGINDPFTAGTVIERLGDALCRLVGRHLPAGAVCRDGQVVLLHPVTDYSGLCDAIFHPIRQNGSGSAFVLIRILDVLAKVAEVEPSPERRRDLWRHGQLALEIGEANLQDRAALDDLHRRWARLTDVLARGGE